jgi:amino acid transporter
VRKLSRELGFWGTASLSVGGMAPTLAMSVTGVQAARLLGPAAPLAYVLAGLGMVFIGYGFVRLSAAFSHAGSVYAFVGRTLGPRAGFFTTWALLGTYIVFPPVSVLGVAAFAQAFLRHAGISSSFDWLPLALVGWVAIWLLASRGIKLTARSVIVVEVVSLVLIAALVVVIYIRLGVGDAPGPQTLTTRVLDIPAGTGLATVALAATFGILSYGGFESAMSAGEESHRPRRVIPAAIIAAVVFGAVFYTACIAAVLSSVGAALVGVAVASRTVFALARDGLLPRRLARVGSETSIPTTAVTASMILTVVFLLAFGLAGTSALNAFFYLATIGTLSLLVVYILVSVSAFRLIAAGQVRASRLELILPVGGVAVAGYVLYRNLVPAPASPFDVFPYIVAAWLLVGLGIALAVPGLAQRISEQLALR